MVDLLSLNFSRFSAALLPVGSAILLTILVNLPVSLMGGLFPAPILALPAIYFWALVRPDLMSPFAVLFIGVLEDLLSGGPPGLWAAGFLAAYALADRQRDIALRFVIEVHVADLQNVGPVGGKRRRIGRVGAQPDNGWRPRNARQRRRRNGER